MEEVSLTSSSPRNFRGRDHLALPDSSSSDNVGWGPADREGDFLAVGPLAGGAGGAGGDGRGGHGDGGWGRAERRAWSMFSAALEC